VGVCLCGFDKQAVAMGVWLCGFDKQAALWGCDCVDFINKL